MITDKSRKLIEIFYTYPEKKFHIRELARLTGLSSTGVIKIIFRFKKEGLLTSKKERMVELVSFDKNEKTLALKRSNNLEALYRYNLISYLRDFFEEPEAIVLFGSYATGTDTSESDIDIAVYLDPSDMKEYLEKERRILSALIGKIRTDRIDLRILNVMPLILQYRVFKEGIPILIKDEQTRVDFETGVMNRFFELKPYLDEYKEILFLRIRTGV